ncbi:MAG TPA: carbohydrate-binding protein, partial [Fibrobacteraceae bacterium]|nr:carbohydrate-binding protein [Fibrobacteraceae bacterium]
MASDALRGKLVKTTVEGDKEAMITTYLTQNGKKKSLLVVNKSPYSDFDFKLDIPEFKGKAKMQVLDASTEKLKPGFENDPEKKAKAIDVTKGVKVPKRSLVLITVE